VSGNQENVMQHPALAVRYFSLLLVLLALPALLWSAEVRSPDGSIRFSIEVDDQGAPFYQVDYRDETVAQRSRLGMRFQEQQAFDAGFRIVATHDDSNDTSWEQPWGERRTVIDRHNELLVEFASMDRPLRRFKLRVRVFDDGVGFRYEIPKQSGYATVNIVDELTEFHLPGKATAWWIPGRRFNRYEYLYSTTGLEEIQTAHTPMTVRLPSGTHLSIHEAALVDYAAFVLDQRRPGVFQANLTPWSDGIRVRAKTPFHTPWRTIQIAPDAVGLLNSDLILNLNEPNALGDVSWVKPGKYVGIWWGMHIGANTWGSGPTHGATTEETKKYIDFASKYGIDGVLVEGWNSGWDGDWYSNGDVFSFTEAYPDFDLEELAAYAARKDVELIGHHETSGSITNYEKQMSDAYDLYASHGVRKVKTGYVADAGGLKRVDGKGVEHYEWHDGQFSVSHHLHAVREAAKRKISLNPHEPIKDTGLRRTYPNWISREGARGQEYNAWGEPPNPPEHTAILPYTRMLSGPMDFTPGIFDLTFKGADSPFRVQTTLAKQLALYVVLYSPIQMAADLPENYEQKPEAFRFIVDVPTDWEQSIAVAGEVGDFVAFARKERDSADWYLGALTDETARQLSIPLSFLDANATYMAEIYRDGDGAHWKNDPYDLVIEEREFSKDDLLELPLAAGGGAAVRFRMAE
jgi:alpha-glucosidase